MADYSAPGAIAREQLRHRNHLLTYLTDHGGSVDIKDIRAAFFSPSDTPLWNFQILTGIILDLTGSGVISIDPETAKVTLN